MCVWETHIRLCWMQANLALPALDTDHVSPSRLHHYLVLKVPGDPYPKPLQTLTLFLIKIKLNI